MAITPRKQRLINLHTSAMTTASRSELLSGDVLSYGEIVVEHGNGKGVLYTKTHDSAGTGVELAEFIDKVAVKKLIGEEGVDALKARVGALEETHVSAATGMKSVAQEVTDGINALDATAKTEDVESGKGLQITIVEEDGKLTSASISGDYSQTYDELGAAASAKTEIIDGASTDYNTLKKIESKITSEVEARETADETLQSNIDAIYKSSAGTESGVLMDKINGLNASVEGKNASEQISVKVDEFAGKITAVTVTAVKFDLDGAAASAKTELIGSATTAGDTLKKLEDRIVINKSSIDTLNGNDTTEGSVAKSIKDAIAGLDSEVSSSTNGLTVKVVETDGKLSSVEASIAAETYDDYGEAATAKAQVIGTSGDSENADTIWGAKNYAKNLNVRTENKVSTIQGQLAGFSETEGSVKSYVDQKVTSLLKFKGTVDTIGELPDITSTAVTHGDVYNIVNEFVYSGKTYPAGTNVVAVKLDGETPYWDALGGTVDLTPYAKIEFVTAQTAAIKAIIGGSYTSASTVAADITRVDNKVTTLEGLHKDSATAGTKMTVAEEITEAIAKLDAEKSQAAGTDGLALSISEVDGKITAISGSIAANTYDAYGAANTALTSAKTYTDDKNSAMDARVSALEAKHAEGKTVEQEVKDGIAAITAVTKSGESNGVKVTAITEAGSIKEVLVEAPSFSTIYETKTDAEAKLTSAKTYADTLDSAMDARVDKLEATHATSGEAYQTVAQEVAAGIAAISSASKDSSSCGATATVTTESGSVSSVAIDMTELQIDCGEF